MKLDREEVIRYAEQNGLAMMQAKENLMRIKLRELIMEAKSIDDLKPALIEIVNRI